ncbi:hypothetical protein B0H16DRAFT_1689380 [Mycena metata]|uniref:Uncharacterized protein n=1 Tax=Mycena metata TaxID=1033252 RepID=A0AAD7NF64_9AGAR|nr:hypothetical protein B0H16DRAFT_1689380 [Mycena metata]
MAGMKHRNASDASVPARGGDKDEKKKNGSGRSSLLGKKIRRRRNTARTKMTDERERMRGGTTTSPPKTSVPASASNIHVRDVNSSQNPHGQISALPMQSRRKSPKSSAAKTQEIPKNKTSHSPPNLRSTTANKLCPIGNIRVRPTPLVQSLVPLRAVGRGGGTISFWPRLFRCLRECLNKSPTPSSRGRSVKCKRRPCAQTRASSGTTSRIGSVGIALSSSPVAPCLSQITVRWIPARHGQGEGGGM